MTKLEAAKEAARRRIEETKLDDAIREIAKAGKYDGAANYSNKFDGKSFNCTQSAGVNIALVTAFGPTLIYRVAEYGQIIEVFRDGPWVERALVHAASLRTRRLAAESSTRRDNEDRTLRNFEPFED